MGKHLAIWCASVYRDSVLAIIARRGTNGSEYLKARNPSYNQTMAKNVIHISEAEAATTTVATLLVHVRAGAEVVIENDVRPVAVLRSAEPHPGRLLSESIALAEAHGSTVTLDGDFGRDLEEIINSHREPLNRPHGTDPRLQRGHRC